MNIFCLKIIYIARNPKDIITSFHRILTWGGNEETFAEFSEMFLKGEGLLVVNVVTRFWYIIFYYHYLTA